MLSWVRKLLENWVARAFFALFAVIFVFWGISNVVTLVGSDTAVAHVGGKPVDISAVQAGYQAQLDQARQNGGPTDLPARQRLAGAALADVLRQQALGLEQNRLGIAAPPAAIRQVVYGIPAFQTNGAFDQARFAQVLQANSKTPEQFLAAVKQNIVSSQLMLPIIAAAAPPRELVSQIFAFIAEQRFAETVTIPIAGASPPAAPADAVLRRYWRNHQSQFAAPAYRQIKLVLLSPAVLAQHEAVSDADVAAAYGRATAGQPAVALRSVQVITSADAGRAAAIAARWQGGASWADMQALAKQDGATAIALDQATQAQFPSPQMAAAVFAAAPNTVTGPVPGPFGSFVFKVTDVRSSQPDADNVRAEIKQQLQLQKAQADVAQDVDALQDALAAQTPLDQLPGNIGLAALQGNLDASGNTEDGTPAPIPGGAAVHDAVVKAAFATPLNQPAQLVTVPDGSYFALTVDRITPPSVHPYEQVQAQVLAAWAAEQASRAAEVKAAGLLAAVNAGQSLDAAASAAGYSVTMSPPITRNAPPAGISSQLAQILFSLQPGQPTMRQTDTGFMVAVLARVVQPKPEDDPADYAQAQQAMVKSMQSDVADSFFAGLQARDRISVDQKLFAQIYQ